MTGFYSCHKTAKCFLRVYMVLGDAVKKLDFCMDFEPCLKVHSLISVQYESIKLSEIIHVNVVFQGSVKLSIG